MIATKYVILSLGLALLCVVRPPSTVRASPDWPRALRFQVVTSFGQPLDYKLVVLKARDNDRNYLANCKAAVCRSLPLGVYIFRLLRPSTGDILEGSVLVSESAQVLTVDADLGGNKASRDSEGYVIEGDVKSPSKAPMPEWVRLQSLYSDWNRQVAVTPLGQFVFENIPAGTAMLLFYRSGQVVHTELVTTKGARSDRVRIAISLGQQPTITTLVDKKP